MMSVSLETVVLTAILVIFLFNVVAFAFFNKAPNFPSIKYLFAANAYIFSGLCLYSMQAEWNLFVSALVATSLIHTGVFHVYLTARSYLGLSLFGPITSLSAYTIPVQACLAVYFLYFDPSQQARINVLSIFVVFHLSTIVYDFVRARNERRVVRVTIIAVVSVIIFLITFRAVNSSYDPSSLYVFDGGATNILFIIGVVLAVMFLNFAYVFLVIFRNYLNTHHLSRTDPGTGLLNRRAFEEIVGREIKRANRYGGVFSLVLCDLDHFKRINDNYGHPVGDAVLKQFAKILTQNLRGSDVVARVGGEEFMIFLPNIEGERALEVVDGLRQKCEKAVYSGCEREKVTSSFGITERRHRCSYNQLRTEADTALYNAKEDGRNCCSRFVYG